MDSYKLRVANTIEESIVDGPGIRYVIFVQGCPHHCPNCHNPETHNSLGGTLVSIGDLFQQIMKNPLLDGVTFSGGEPFMQSEALFVLGKALRQKGLHVMTYTGYTHEQLQKEDDPHWQSLLSVTDCLVDGPYVEEEKTMLTPFKGSANQRIISLRI